MSLITCGGADVIRGRLHLPARGPWFAWLQLDTATAPTGWVTLAASGGLSLRGTVQVGGVELDSARVRVVGGAGGLATLIPRAAFQNALLRDPLQAIMSAAGETSSTSIDASITSVLLATWTHIAQRATTALDLLCYAAGQQLGQAVTWRVAGDGTIWIGVEAWTAQSLPAGSDLISKQPDAGLYELGVQTPWLLPGVNLAGVGNVGAVDHFFEPDSIRSLAWQA
jgi:hypothetical protein